MSFWQHKRKVIQNSTYLSKEEADHAIKLTHIFENLSPHPSSLYFTVKNEMVLLWKFGNPENPTLLEVTIAPEQYEGTVRIIEPEEIKEE